MLLRIFTIVGGHFISGHKAKGLVFLILLALLPFATLVLVALIGNREAATRGSAIVTMVMYLVLLAATWGLSVRSAGLDLRQDQVPEQTLEARRKSWQLAAASIFAWVAIGFGFLVCVLSPLVTSGHFENGLTIFTWKSTKDSPGLLGGFQQLPNGTGDVQIVGRVTKDQRPLARQELRILFAGSISSSPLVTNDSGEFRMRLPQGTWRLEGPIIPAMPKAVFRFEVSGAIDQASRTIEVKPDGPLRVVEVQIDVQSP